MQVENIHIQDWDRWDKHFDDLLSSQWSQKNENLWNEKGHSACTVEESIGWLEGGANL